MNASHNRTAADRTAVARTANGTAALGGCSICGRPIFGNGAVCHFCGANGNHILKVHVADRAPRASAISAGVRIGRGWLVAKIGCVALASIAAAALLWYHQYGEIRSEWMVLQAILRDAEVNFAVGLLVSLIPRSSGLLLALLVVGARTYVAWYSGGAI
jgi:hypothetical protein